MSSRSDTHTAENCGPPEQQIVRPDACTFHRPVINTDTHCPHCQRVWGEHYGTYEAPVCPKPDDFEKTVSSHTLRKVAEDCARIAAERDRLAAALKAEQHAHTESLKAWHGNFVHADQGRMAAEAERDRLAAFVQRVADEGGHRDGLDWSIIAKDTLNGTTPHASTAAPGVVSAPATPSVEDGSEDTDV